MVRVETSSVVGRFLVFALMVLQCFFLASCPAHYENEGDWYAVSILFIPATVMWWWMNSNNAELCQVLLFWMIYVWLGVVPMVGIVFGRIGGKIESKGFWNASTLMMTLCITPILVLLTLYTRIATSQPVVYANRFCEWTAKVTINVFDRIELLGLILPESEYSHRISKDFKNAVIAFTCMSFLWWPLGTVMDRDAAKCDYQERDKPLYLLSCGIQVHFDTIFFGLRLGLCLGYGKHISVFTNKNIIFIILYSWRIFTSVFCRLDDISNPTANQQHGELNEPSTSPSPRRAISSNAFTLNNDRNSSAVASAPPPYTANQQQDQSIVSSTSTTPGFSEYTPRVFDVRGFGTLEGPRFPSAPTSPCVE